MSLSSTADGRVIHFPRNPDSFTFDAEVSDIFPDMARRSIPLFYETHALHASLCRPWMENPEGVTVLDAGASRGAFLAELAKQYPEALQKPTTEVHACDISPDMCAHLRRDFPWAGIAEYDLSDPCKYLGGERYDIINCTYVLQFIPAARQVGTLIRLSRSLKPGGVLFLGQKMSVFGPAGRMLHDQYIQFRMSHGYTREEIDAKTKALAGSMSTFPENVLHDYLCKFGLQVLETSRWTVFNNYMCTKGL